jgi:hypothetical protein
LADDVENLDDQIVDPNTYRQFKGTVAAPSGVIGIQEENNSKFVRLRLALSLRNAVVMEETFATGKEYCHKMGSCYEERPSS